MTIEITDFSVTPIQAKTGDQISVNAQIDCTNYLFMCGNAIVSIKVNGQQTSSESVPIDTWAGFGKYINVYTKKITMPSTNAFIEVSFQEDNKITRQASVVNVSPPPVIVPPGVIPPGITPEDSNMLTGAIVIVAIGIGVIYLLKKD